MAKLMKKKLMLYDDPYFGDFKLDVLRISRHARERANERKIPVAELTQKRSHINGYVDKIVSKDGVVITAYPRVPVPLPLPENGKRFMFPRNGIPHFIGKLHVNINRIRAEYQLKSLYFDKDNTLVAVAPTSDYDWKLIEEVIETARKKKYKTPQQLSAAKKNKF